VLVSRSRKLDLPDRISNAGVECRRKNFMFSSPQRRHPAASCCDASRVQITGHRGQVLADGAVENTVDAVDAALSAGADGVEVDVRLSADGEPVCIHDTSLMRVAGLPVQARTLTYEQLRQVPLVGEQRIAHLRDIADVVRGRGTLLVEVKHDPRSAAHAGAAALRLLAATGAGNDVVISSFSRSVLRDVRQHDSNVRRALVTGREVSASAGFADVVANGHHELHAHQASVLSDHGVAERARAEGVVLRCWTVNRGLDARLLEIAGVAGVISDRPGALRTEITEPMPHSAIGKQMSTVGA